MNELGYQNFLANRRKRCPPGFMLLSDYAAKYGLTKSQASSLVNYQRVENKRIYDFIAIKDAAPPPMHKRLSSDATY